MTNDASIFELIFAVASIAFAVALALYAFFRILTDKNNDPR